MPRALRLVIAFVAGWLAGSAVNMGLVMAGGRLIPAPAGVDVTTMEGLKAGMHLFGPENFLFPFLAHALGTLAGAMVATWLTPGRTRGPALAVGIVFLLGGIAVNYMLPGPLWFTLLDVLVAYLPMAWLGHRLAAGRAARAGA